MTASQIIHPRLINQHIIAGDINKPEQIVKYLVAMQSQEYAMAKWAIGLRQKGVYDSDVEQAFNEGKILRTHVMRPTWHFVSPEDIRWLLQLTAKRVHAVSAYYYRKMELDSKVFKRSNSILVNTLRDDNYSTRSVLRSALNKAKINTDEQRMAYLLMYAELEGIICSGPREGKQFTYALLEERVAPVKHRTIDEALYELTQRYFVTRGPATLQDFIWWSGLSAKDAGKGISMLDKDFESIVIDGKTYIHKPQTTSKISKTKATFLLPDYDEYGISYKDRSLIFKKADTNKGVKSSNFIFSHMIVLDGIVAGTWQKDHKPPHVKTTSFAPLSKDQQASINVAVKRYLNFTAK